MNHICYIFSSLFYEMEKMDFKEKCNELHLKGGHIGLCVAQFTKKEMIGSGEERRVLNTG